MPVRRRGPGKREGYRALTIRELLALAHGPPWYGEFESDAEARAAHDAHTHGELEEMRRDGFVFYFGREGDDA